MLGAMLGLFLLATDPAVPDPASLVSELGSSRYRQRESAEVALTKMGRGAMPSLRAALAAKDPEVRLRASAILSRIESALLVEPTPIAFDFHDVTVADAVRAINLKSGLSLQLNPQDIPTRVDHRITLRTTEPLPFWRGIDALCQAGGLHYDLGSPHPAGRRERAFPLYPGHVATPEPAWDSGPFRTHLTSVHYQSDIQLSRPRPASGEEPSHGTSAPIRQFYLQLMTAAEPRLSITRNGDPRIIEAFDDLGRSLLMPPAQATLQRASGYFGLNPSPVVRFRIDLAYPESSSRRIKRLRGVIPVVVATRKPDPLKVSLEGAIGRSFRNADIDLTIREVRDAREGQPSAIEVTLKSIGGSAVPTGEVDPIAARLESPQEQVEVLDASGESLAWFPSSSSFNGEETRLTLSLIAKGKPAKPSLIAYHGMTRALAEVPFEFRDVPIP